MILLLVITIISAILLQRQKYFSNTKVVPAYGSKYIEGIVSNNVSDLKPVINYLTRIGLVAFDINGKIIPALAESWEISEDQKTYTFHLRNFLKADDIINTIKQEKSQWQDIEIKVQDGNSIQFILSQPFSPFLASLTEHLFPYGPYKIKSEEKQKIIFSARDDFYLGKSYISEIEIMIYPNEVNLSKSLKSEEINGVAKITSQIEIPSDFINYNFNLPRYQVLFFNLNSEVFLDNSEIRKKFKNDEMLSEETNIRLVTNNTEKNLAKAQELKERWAKIGAIIEIESYGTVELQTNIIPNRNYDMLLYGLDYGSDPDSYAFWHSSQMTNTGLNLSNFSSVDADKILEEARQTLDEGKRTELYDKLQGILDDEVSAIFLSQENHQYAISNKVKGIIPDHQATIPQDRYFEVWNWYIKEKRVAK